MAASGTGMAVESTSSENTDYENYGILTFISENGGVYSTFPSGATGEGLSYYLASVKNEDSNPDYSEYYFNGKRVKFLPKTTFRYIWNETTHPKIQHTLKQKMLWKRSIKTKPRRISS